MYPHRDPDGEFAGERAEGVEVGVGGEGVGEGVAEGLGGGDEVGGFGEEAGLHGKAEKRQAELVS